MNLRDWQDRMDDYVGGVQFTFMPMPWDWRLSYYRDSLDPFWTLNVGPFQVMLTLNFLTTRKRRKERTRAAEHWKGTRPHMVIFDEVQDWQGKVIWDKLSPSAWGSYRRAMEDDDPAS